MGYPVQQGNTTIPLEFEMVLTSDHVSPATGLAPTVTISKNGAAFAAPAGAVTEVGNGLYKVAANATDAGTLGPIKLYATAATADPGGDSYLVVSYNPYDAVHLGLSALPGVAAGAAGGLPTATNASGQVTASSVAGSVASVAGAVGSVAVGGLPQADLATGTQSGLTAQGYTSTRAGYIDVLNGLVAAVWGALTSGLTTAGSIGKLLSGFVFSGANVNAAAQNLPGDYQQRTSAVMLPTTAPTGYGGSTAAQIATAVWEDLTAGADFAVAGSAGAMLIAIATATGKLVFTGGNVNSSPQTNVNLNLAQVLTGSSTVQAALINALTGEGSCVVVNDPVGKTLKVYSDPAGTATPTTLVDTIPYTVDANGNVTRRG